MPSHAKDRKAQFLNPRGGPASTLSTSLVKSALTLLEAALAERRREVVRTPTNHFSDNAVGAIAIVVAALDVWTSESFAWLAGFGVSNARTKAVTIYGIAERYSEMAKLAGVSVATAILDDIALVAEVRHDIVHHLMRPIPDPLNVPSWLEPLSRRGLFVSLPRTHINERGSVVSDFGFADKLGSYALAYWAFRTAEAATHEIVSGTRPEWADLMASAAGNFTIYRGRGCEACPPEELHLFDAKYGLTLTPA